MDEPIFPHCDQRVLHAPGECQFCDEQPLWQRLRQGWGIAFTGHTPQGSLPFCRAPGITYGYEWTCQKPIGHEGDHGQVPAPDILPCPADFARPADSPADHRLWPGNRAYPGGA